MRRWRSQVEAAVVEPERRILVNVDLRRPGAGLFEDRASAFEVEPLGAVDGDGIDVADTQDARAVLAERVELGRRPASKAGTSGKSHTVDDDQARGVDIDAESARAGDIVETPGDPERAACPGADAGVEGEGDGAGIGVVSAEARELPGEVDAAIEDIVSALQGDGVTDGDVIEELDARAAPIVRRGGNRAAAGCVVVAEAQDAAGDGDRAGPAGIVGGEGEDAGVTLAERAVGVAGESERRGERQDFVAGDFKGVVRLIEDEGASRGEGIRRAEAHSEEAVRIEGHAVIDRTQSGVGVGSKHAAEDVDRLPCPAERIDGTEFEGARAGLDQAEVARAVVDDAGQDEAGVLEPVGSRADREVGRAAHGGRAGDLEAVAREVRDAHDISSDAQRTLLDDLVARERTATGAIDGDGGVAGDRDVAADCEFLEGAASIAVRRDRKTAGDEDGAGVVADVERAEARLVDDVRRDRRRGVGQGDRQQRIQDGDVPDGRQGRDAIERERRGARGGRSKDRITLEGDGIANGPSARGDEAGIGPHREGGSTERTRGDHTRERVAVGTDGEAAGGDVHATCEGVGTGELEHTVAGFGDATVLDDRDDVQRRLQRSERDAVSDMGTNDKRRRWLGSEVEDTVGERR